MKKYMPFITLGFFLIFPMLGVSTYVMHIFILLLMWTTIGMSWNLLSGYCGQVSFGHAAFFGIGAYTSGVLYSKLSMSPWLGLPLSIITVGILSFIIGLAVLRLRGPFFALATLASGEVFRVTAENMEWLTSGTLGIMLQQRLWVSKLPYYYIILAITVAVFLLMKYLLSTKLGYYFVAIREDQDAAESLGINTTLYKTIALIVSAVVTGIAGAFYMNYMGYIDPHIVFALHDISIITIMIVMVGGVATQWGPFIGAVIMVLLQEAVRSIPGLGAMHQAIFGGLLIFIIIFLPNGIVGDFKKIKRFFGLRSA
ncbi:MAG: branched-chain amino acid ABC transporter permease [Deferribacterales bacterium]